MKVFFLHGWTSVPGGRKPTHLNEHGHEVINPALPDEDFEESVRIQKQLRRAEQERATREKVTAYFAKGLREVTWINQHKSAFPVTELCHVPGVSRSGFYDSLNRPPSERPRQADRIRELAVQVHQENDTVYGPSTSQHVNIAHAAC